MTKDVLLSIKGLQFEGENDASDLETITAAQYYKKNNNFLPVSSQFSQNFSFPCPVNRFLVINGILFICCNLA